MLKYKGNMWRFPTFYFMLSYLLRLIMSVYSHKCYRSLEYKKEILKFFVQERGLLHPIPLGLYNKSYVTFKELLYDTFNRVLMTYSET